MNSQWKLPLAIAGGFSVLVMGVENFRYQGWEGHINCLDDRLRGKEMVSVQEVRMACGPDDYNGWMGAFR